MKGLRLICEQKERGRKVMVFGDDRGNLMFSFLRDGLAVDGFGTDDFLVGVGQVGPFLLEIADEEMHRKSRNHGMPYEDLDYDIDILGPDAVRVKVMKSGKVLFHKLCSDEIQAEEFGRNCVEELRENWSLVENRGPVASRGVRFMIGRKNETHRASIVHVSPSSNGGGLFGTAIVVYHGGKKIYERMRVFTSAVTEGNFYVPIGESRGMDAGARDETDFYGAPVSLSDEEISTRSEEESSDRAESYTGYEYEKENIRTVVAKLPNVVPTGYKVMVHVDGKYITMVMKDRNTDKHPYTLEKAIKRARSLVKDLQGWSTRM